MIHDTIHSGGSLGDTGGLVPHTSLDTLDIRSNFGDSSSGFCGVSSEFDSGLGKHIGFCSDSEDERLNFIDSPIEVASKVAEFILGGGYDLFGEVSVSNIGKDGHSISDRFTDGTGDEDSAYRHEEHSDDTDDKVSGKHTVDRSHNSIPRDPDH
ncbi:hypothetical protein PilKf_00428 [Pillotina sp. SPG140]